MIRREHIKKYLLYASPLFTPFIAAILCYFAGVTPEQVLTYLPVLTPLLIGLVGLYIAHIYEVPERKYGLVYSAASAIATSIPPILTLYKEGYAKLGYFLMEKFYHKSYVLTLSERFFLDNSVTYVAIILYLTALISYLLSAEKYKLYFATIPPIIASIIAFAAPHLTAMAMAEQQTNYAHLIAYAEDKDPDCEWKDIDSEFHIKDKKCGGPLDCDTDRGLYVLATCKDAKYWAVDEEGRSVFTCPIWIHLYAESHWRGCDIENVWFQVKFVAPPGYLMYGEKSFELKKSEIEGVEFTARVNKNWYGEFALDVPLIDDGTTPKIVVFAYIVKVEEPKSCGNGKCEPKLGENSTSCPEDCTPPPEAEYGNGVCKGLPIEHCGNSPDCKCPTGYVCAPESRKANKRGCVYAVCGDGVCEGAPIETTKNCPEDCGTPLKKKKKELIEKTCGDGICDVAIEDENNCPEDCAPKKPQFPKKNMMFLMMFMFMMMPIAMMSQRYE